MGLPTLPLIAPDMNIDMDIDARLARIRLLLMDVDGVLTDGRLYHFPNAQGEMVETKGFDSQDGIALQWCARLGIKTGVISGRLSPATVERARQTKMAHVYQGHTEKIPIIEEILGKEQMDPQEVGYIGDDLTDIVVMRRVGIGIAPANSRPEVKRAAHWTLQAQGGSGAVREAVERMLQAKGLWTDILRHYEAE